MKCDEAEIVNLFSDDISKELTIHQISKLAKKSYSYTNNIVHSMIDECILNKKVYGNAIVCSLNRKSDFLVSLLSLNSAKAKEKFLEKQKNKDEIIKKLNETSDDDVIVYYGDVKVMQQPEMNLIVLKNFELYWRKILRQQ